MAPGKWCLQSWDLTLASPLPSLQPGRSSNKPLNGSPMSYGWHLHWGVAVSLCGLQPAGSHAWEDIPPPPQPVPITTSRTSNVMNARLSKPACCSHMEAITVGLHYSLNAKTLFLTTCGFLAGRTALCSLAGMESVSWACFCSLCWGAKSPSQWQLREWPVIEFDYFSQFPCKEFKFAFKFFLSSVFVT
jgi:hypothetical protein